MRLICVLLATLVQECFQDQKICSQTPFHYEYTECDSKGNRLKIQVPNETCVGNVEQPSKAKSCFFSCKAGTYLDAQTEDCRPCPPGTYSLGGGYRYEDFSGIPSEFTVTKDEDFETLFGFNGESEAGDQTLYSCKKSGWIASNGYLIYLPGNCVSILSYSVRLVRPGIVRFTYLYSDKDVVFIFSVKNAQCMAATDEQARQGSVPRMTLDGKWRTYEYNLKTGQTVLSWKGFSYSGGIYQPVLIKSIEITGIAFAQQCSPCANGTYSKGGQSVCSPCQPGTFSEKGTTFCKNCDAAKTYSDFQSAHCVNRPPCASEDYSPVYLFCQDAEKAMVSYDWLQPKTCTDGIQSAVKLPQPLKSKECSRCNVGQQMTPTGCRFCPQGFYADGKSADCKQCPRSTQPSYGYRFHTWYVMPEHMNASCEAMEDDTIDCRKGSSWILDGNCIKTAKTRIKDVYFSLMLHVSGFKNVFNRGQISERNPVGFVNFEFETICSTTECAFYLAERPVKRKSKDYEIWAQWNGTLPRQTISIPIVETGETTFYWLFVRSQRSRNSKEDSWFKDQAKIFSINVTNTIDGGAQECLPCPISNKDQCEACPPGHYLNMSDLQCQKCPINTYLNVSSEQPTQDSCVPCGLNLKSTNGVSCDSDCTFNISRRYYDLRPLKGNYTVNGVQIFNRDVRYYHVFNFTVCSSDMIQCFSSVDSAYLDDSKSSSSGGSLACRFVAVPEQKKVRYLGAAQIGDYLVGVSDNLSFVDIEVSNNDSLKWRYSQLFFLYRDSNGKTKNCPRGRNTILIFRCDPAKNETKIELPTSCPDGTCDGCLFQIIITSRSACPVCLDADYVRILGECRMGRQIVHYVPAEHCVIAGQYSMETKVIQCRLLPMEVQITIGLTLSIALILLISLARVWKKNKRLEYKYMKLVESSGKAGELPAVESCALHEGDEEEDEDENNVDRVVFTKGGKANKWFSKGKFSSTQLSNSRIVDRTGSENRALTADNDD